MSARDSSSSEDEHTDRIKEAVWSFGPEIHRIHEDGGTDTHSKRVKVCEHEHGGNELKTTPEFRSHVAKKLGAMLDSVICEVFRESPDCKSALCENTQDDDDEDEDDGFRLFSTSLPGNWREEPKHTLPPKRRPAPSSSDSDSEMESRLREAAVSVSDLFSSSSTERRQQNERTDAGARDEESTEPKKKRKTEREEEESVALGDGAFSQEQSRGNTLKKKRKKKKVKE
ncbi:hypothetical protein KOW79_003779 [Hemibagrus wyckioides]|uniref:Protein CUSTOS n=1 Tax=Hemibagrus wyckioides TaxID=337641 RepID=A0A9D3NZP7_9TELE|nr:protein CUSTOS [Hemibagrus wyckioides]XP_058245263.1 protein CUSTOS [Hemibagrus wyckioides]XP_058245264.1 protein CUSTOS [Hemibagrus wyckioides]KAG7331945.1 hypothetical protein KOW79_003779 [Hemibagrus wyckioides]